MQHSQDLSEREPTNVRETRWRLNVQLPALLHRVAKLFPEYRGQVWKSTKYQSIENSP
jgi:hypothetical protein